MILTAGLSPAWQQILQFGELQLGEVNRAAAAKWCASGKGLNVGRAVASLGGEGHTLCTVGGLAGEAIRNEFADEGIPATWIETGSATRVCTTLIDASQSPARVTELVENAQPITPDESSAFETGWRQHAGTADVAVLTGSIPDVQGQGRPTDLWARLLEDGPPTILDVRGPELIAALAAKPLLVKPNREELAATVGRELSTQPEVIAAIRELCTAGAQWVLITDGPRPALLSDGERTWRLKPPTTQIVNPIGCGDCLTAGIAVFLDVGPQMVRAVRYGMAAAVVNARNLLPARLSLEEVDRTVQDVTCDEITSYAG